MPRSKLISKRIRKQPDCFAAVSRFRQKSPKTRAESEVCVCVCRGYERGVKLSTRVLGGKCGPPGPR